MAVGSAGDPVWLGETTGMGMTVMGMEGGGSGGGTGAGRHSARSSSFLTTLLMWMVEV